jgi:hypothetical protein
MEVSTNLVCMFVGFPSYTKHTPYIVNLNMLNMLNLIICMIPMILEKSNDPCFCKCCIQFCFKNVQIFNKHYKSELVSNYLEKLKQIILQSSKQLCIKDEISSFEPCSKAFTGNERNENA